MAISRIFKQLQDQFNLAYFLLCQNLSENIYHKIAFYEADNAISYELLLSLVKKCASYLRKQGLKNNSKIGVLLPDGVDFVIVFLGSIWSGIIPVLINENLSDADICSIIDDSEIEALVTSSRWQELINEHNFPCLNRWFYVDEKSGLQRKIRNAEAAELPAETCKYDVAFWLYTSGSTGRPKGVMHLHGNPIVAAENCAKHHFEFRQDDLFYSAPSMAFGYGLGTSLYMPLYLGASAVLSSAKKASSFIKILNKFDPTLFFGVPNNYANIIALRDISPLANKQLRLCISSGEQLPERLWRRWQNEYGHKICEGIGSSESMHMFIANSLQAVKPGSSGKVVYGYEVDLLDENNRTVEGPGVGLLTIKGEGFSAGYWDRSSEVQNLFTEEMQTGDIYSRDEEGFFYFLGRMDGLVKTNGMWVFPKEIETVILECEAVAEAAVIRVERDDLISGASELAAFVVVGNGDDDVATVELEVRRLLKEKLHKYKIPKKIVVITDMPRTATGKVDRQSLLKKIKKEAT